jgi:hypothetical protein
VNAAAGRERPVQFAAMCYFGVTSVRSLLRIEGSSVGRGSGGIALKYPSSMDIRYFSWAAISGGLST